jgi:hypothetical protein
MLFIDFCNNLSVPFFSPSEDEYYEYDAHISVYIRYSFVVCVPCVLMFCR